MIIIKNTLGRDGNFGFTSTTLSGFSLTTVDGIASTSFNNLDVDLTYDVAETSLTGWELNSATCDNGETIDSIDLEPGQSVTCNFEKEKAGSIVIVKNTLGGDATTSSTKVPVNPGTYSADETQLSSYSFTGFSGDCDSNRSVTVAFGETKTCTLTNYQPTGAILPTRTTCEQFRDGTGETMQQYYPPNGYVYYMLEGKLINTINPGVFFYYSEVTLAGGEFTINVSQSNNKGWPEIPTQVGDNILLWDSTCTKVQDLTAAFDPATGNANISGSVPAGVYYISVKWEPSAYYNKVKQAGLLGYAPTDKPMVTYSFQVYLSDDSYSGPIASSGSSQIIAPKK